MNLSHREKKRMYREQSGFFERLIAAFSYITFGTVGFIWFLIGVVFGWVIIASMFPSVGEAMLEEGFIAQAIDTVKGWFIK